MNKIKKFALEAFISFVLWTLLLSPYVIFVTGMNLEQYLSWVMMEAMLVPPVSLIVLYVLRKVVK